MDGHMADVSTGDMQAGCQNKPTVFLFDETQIVQETFLEDINNILTSGTKPCWGATSTVTNPVSPVNLSAPDHATSELQQTAQSYNWQATSLQLSVLAQTA